MISSREKAPRHGSGYLLVDGADTAIVRKATFAFRPTSRQAGLLLLLLRICCEVYNAALQERRDAWRWTRSRVSVVDQFNQIKPLRGVRDDIMVFGIQPLRGVLRRVDEAFSAFYRRCRNGQTPGYPRFKSHRRFDTAMWDEPTSWKLELANGTLYIQGVGKIRLTDKAVRQLRRFADRGGVPVTLTVTRHKAGTGWSWRAVVAFKEVTAHKQDPTVGNDSLTGADRGVAVTLALSDGELLQMPEFVGVARDRIGELSRQMAKKRPGSRAHRELARRIRKLYAKASRQSDHWARETAKELVARYGIVVLEDLRLQNMTRSARGTMESPGTYVAAKQALNRRLCDAALGRLRHWICVKAEEAGRRVWVVNPANTSRECVACGYTHVANRVNRDTFRCLACGHLAHADINASQNIAARGAAAEAAWRAAGSPLLVRPAPRMRRRNAPEPTAALEGAA